MAVTPLPSLDRTAATFKTDTDTFFGSLLPTFSVQVNQVAGAADASAAAALASKNAATASESAALSSKNAAGTSATNAATSASGAATSATNSANSATASAGSAAAANTSKNAAATSATNAATSATQAAAAAASIADGPVTSVNGKTGVVALVKADVGLSLVDNISVKAAGVGVNTQLSDTPNIDDYTLPNGWYGVGPGSAGVRPVVGLSGLLQASSRAFGASTRVNQLFFVETGVAPRLFIRINYNTVWTDWVETTLPALTGNARKPLTPGDAATDIQWADTLSISKYIDKIITGTPGTALAMNLNLATVFDLSLTANVTFTLSNLPTLSSSVSPTVAGESLTVIVRVRQNASPKTITWFSGITWLTPGGLVPAVPAASQIIEYILSTTGTGTTWVGRVGAST